MTIAAVLCSMNAQSDFQVFLHTPVVVPMRTFLDKPAPPPPPNFGYDNRSTYRFNVKCRSLTCYNSLKLCALYLQLKGNRKQSLHRTILIHAVYFHFVKAFLTSKIEELLPRNLKS